VTGSKQFLWDEMTCELCQDTAEAVHIASVSSYSHMDCAANNPSSDTKFFPAIHLLVATSMNLVKKREKT